MADQPLQKDIVISARGIERTFADRKHRVVHALGPIDLDIAEGTFTCIVGPSGCGKSTFLRVIAGLVAPTAGTMTVRTRKTDQPPMAMVFQDYSVYPWKTVEANVMFGLRSVGKSKGEAREITAHWLARTGLSDFATAYPGTLSGGMRQRVSVARALALNPAILIMDEPFAALDAQLRRILQDELLALWQEQNQTVVFVTHSLEEAVILGDRVLVMSSRPGRIIELVDVPFERPRSGEVRGDPVFGAIVADLWSHLKGEVEQADDTDEAQATDGGAGSAREGLDQLPSPVEVP